MRLFRWFAAALSMAGILLAGVPASAAPRDAILNKEGYWGIDVDNGACAASMTLQGGAVFLLRAVEGNVTFGLFSHAPLRRGKAGRLQTEAHGVDFVPSFSEESETLFYDGEFEAEALAALRTADELRILIDGEPVAAMTLEGTGFAGAFDGVIACSQGKSGWWGPGVGADGQVASSEEPAPPLNAEGYWSITTGEVDPGVCYAISTVDEGHVFMLIANHRGEATFAVGSESPMKLGRKGRFETDAYVFDFRPTYDDDTLVFGEDLDSQAIFAIRRAGAAKISIGGQTLVDMTLEGSGHAAVIDDLMACARSESGWWGEGAAKPEAQ
ncbi:MAG: hypothetical protein ACOY5Y_16225 [Pseudomonadota bacterium]